MLANHQDMVDYGKLLEKQLPVIWTYPGTRINLEGNAGRTITRAKTKRTEGKSAINRL